MLAIVSQVWRRAKMFWYVSAFLYATMVWLAYQVRERALMWVDCVLDARLAHDQLAFKRYRQGVADHCEHAHLSQDTMVHKS